MPTKPNNSNSGEEQPYIPAGNGEKSGEYTEKDYSHDLYNYYARKLGGSRADFPLNFPSKEHHPAEYIADYFNSLINWSDSYVPDGKMMFLIDINNKKERYKIFRDKLGFNEQNVWDLEKQILDGSRKYKIFLTKTADKYGFRVKIYMPIYSYDRSRYLMIRTGWLLAEGQKPRFITAFYEKDFERNLKNEI